MKKDNQNKNTEKYPVREGQENSSIAGDKHPPAKNKYPRPEEKDKQEKNQPEFIEPQSNRKSK
jgi:hypothetical protein